MRLNTCSRALSAVLAGAVLLGCAAPAPDLPRQVRQTSETGYVTSQNSVADLPLGKKVAMIIRSAWLGLADDEREKLDQAYQTKIIEDDQFGVITDVQGADQSTLGTNSGAMLGGAVANAAYIDNALRGGNYSATNQLAVGILGAVIGSNMDSRPSSQFQFRYTVKLGDGDIKYFDEVKSTSFRHSVGVCILLPSLNLVSQHVCNQTPDSVRKRYLN